MQNLKALYAGAELYRQENNQWPQVRIDTSSEDGSRQFALAWIGMLQPFGVLPKTWICPEIEQLIGSPDYSEPANARLDYFPMPFDSNPMTPHQWPTQPWFIERTNVHGHGTLIIFTDGSITDSDTIAQRTANGSP